MATDELGRFVDEMISQNNLTSLTGELREQLVADLRERLNDQINRALIEAMPEDTVNTFIELMDNPDTTDESLQKFVVDSGIDVRRITTETMTRFYNLYVARPKN